MREIVSRKSSEMTMQLISNTHYPMVKSFLLHDVKGPPVDQSINDLCPVLLQSEPCYTGGQETHYSNCGPTELETSIF